MEIRKKRSNRIVRGGTRLKPLKPGFCVRKLPEFFHWWNHSQNSPFASPILYCVALENQHFCLSFCSQNSPQCKSAVGSGCSHSSPEGRRENSPTFQGWVRSSDSVESPGGTAEFHRSLPGTCNLSVVPSGLIQNVKRGYPTLKGWASVNTPSGRRPSVDDSSRMQNPGFNGLSWLSNP